MSAADIPSNSNLPSFRYSHLAPDNSQIRLLHIHSVEPSSGLRNIAVNSPVHCTLNTNTQALAPRYKALSYSWGALAPTESIILNGAILPVTFNLLGALKQLRNVAKGPEWREGAHEEVVLWVDAVCINQVSSYGHGAGKEDDDERSMQVSKMRSIYEGAEEVLVWLGEADEDGSTLRAFQYVRDVVALLKLVSEGRGVDSNSVDAFIANSNRYSDLLALRALLLRPYWKRMWVIQETHVARSITIHCGNESMRWEDLLATQDVLNEHEGTVVVLSGQHGMGMALLREIWKSGVKGMRTALEMPPETDGSKTVEKEQEPGLFESLLYHSEKLCSYPIDRVYSIVGFTSARHDPRFVIDYSRGARRVYMDVAQLTILTTQKLSITCALQPIPGSRNLLNPELPSWVPDWASQNPYQNHLFRNDLPSSFHAAGTSVAEASFSKDGNVLIAKGFIVASIISIGSATGISSPWETENDDVSNLLLAIHSWRAMLLQEDCEIGHNSHILFRDTITCAEVNHRFFPGWTVEKYLEELMGLYGWLCRRHHPKLVLDKQWAALTEDNSSWESETQREHWAYTAILNNKRALYRRRFFVADYGLIGVGHEDILEGDRICILYGLQTPVILRRVGNHYTLVGEAFVSGRAMMWGAGMEEMAEGKHTEQIFSIH